MIELRPCGSLLISMENHALCSKAKGIERKVSVEQDQPRHLSQQKQLVLNQLAEIEMTQDQRTLEEGDIASRLALTVEFEEIQGSLAQTGG